MTTRRPTRGTQDQLNWLATMQLWRRARRAVDDDDAAEMDRARAVYDVHAEDLRARAETDQLAAEVCGLFDRGEYPARYRGDDDAA